MDATRFLIVPLLQGFEWFDEGLQRSLRAAGWPALSRPESMVMTHVQLGVVRPAEIARQMGLTRQAVASTVKALVARGVFELADDPADRRAKLVRLTPQGQAMRADAMGIVDALTAELSFRIGPDAVAALQEVFAHDWGSPVLIKTKVMPHPLPSSAQRGPSDPERSRFHAGDDREQNAEQNRATVVRSLQRTSALRKGRKGG